MSTHSDKKIRKVAEYFQAHEIFAFVHKDIKEVANYVLAAIKFLISIRKAFLRSNQNSSYL